MQTNQHSTMMKYIDQIPNKELTAQGLYLSTMENTSVPDEVNLILRDESILRKYRKELREHTKVITLSALDHMRYDYKPWLLSHDLYGTMELWIEILDLNEMRSFSEFHENQVIVFTNDIISILQSIKDLEKEKIALNEDEMIRLKKEAAL